MNDDMIGLDDNAVIASVNRIHGDIGHCAAVHRQQPVRTQRSVITRITVAGPHGALRLTEKVLLGHGDELRNVALMQSLGIAMPQVYCIDHERRVFLMEDCGEGCIQGSVFDEDSELGGIYRMGMGAVLEAAADLHIKCWDNYDVFGKIGLPWHLAHFAAHIKGVEADYRKFRSSYREKLGERPFEHYDGAMAFLKDEYPGIIANRFHQGKHITVIHGDLHPSNTFVSKSPPHGAARMVDFEAVRMGLCTDDLVMFLAFHAAPSRSEAMPWLESYHQKLRSRVSGYSFDELLSDYRASIAENLFFPVRLLNRGIPASAMMDRSLAAYAAFVA